jgi:hypothetical protein
MQSWRKQVNIALLWYVIKKMEKTHATLFWGIISSAIGLVIAGYGQYLTIFVYNAPENPSTAPFYFGITAIILLFTGMAMVIDGWIKSTRAKNS